MLSVQRSKNPFLGFPGGSDGKESFSNEQYQRKQNKVTQSGTYFQSEDAQWNGEETTVMLQTLLQDLNQTLKHEFATIIYGKAIY